jgi:hypothetical protein
LPSVFDAAGIAADQNRQKVLVQITCHSQFPTIQCGVAQSVGSVFRDQLEGDEISPRAANNYFCVNNFHDGILGALCLEMQINS